MKVIYAVLIAMVYLTSCSKENSATAPTTPPSSNADTTTLVKFIVVDSTQTAPFDSSIVYKFDYDNGKRLTKITWQVYNTSSRLLEPRRILTYSYNGSDTLPYRYLETNPNNTFTLDWNHELGYDAQGRLIKDSSNETFNSSPQVYTDRYIYVSDGFRDSVIEYVPTSMTSVGKLIETRDGNNNIIKQIPTTSATATEMVYDDHVNPLYKSSIHYPYLKNSVYPTFFTSAVSVQKNNFTKISTNTYDATGTTLLYSYNTNFAITYKANGQPSIVRVYSTPTAVPTVDKYKYLFFYGN